MTLRSVAIIAAMVTDSVDGHLARRYSSTSRFGAILDPTMDKFFVYFALATLLYEDKIPLLQALAMISRDVSILFFGIYLLRKKRLRSFEVQSVIWGKLTTTLQFVVLLAITFGYQVPSVLFVGFLILAAFFFMELFWTDRHSETQH